MANPEQKSYAPAPGPHKFSRRRLLIGGAIELALTTELATGGYFTFEKLAGIFNRLVAEEQLYQMVMNYLNTAPEYNSVLSKFPGINTPVIIPSEYRNHVLCCFTGDSLNLIRKVDSKADKVTFTRTGAYPGLLVDTVKEKTDLQWECIDLSQPGAENGNLHPNDLFGKNQMGNKKIRDRLISFPGFILFGKSFNGNNWREIVPDIFALLEDEKIIQDPRKADPNRLKHLWNAYFATEERYGNNDSKILEVIKNINIQRRVNSLPAIEVLDVLPFNFSLCKKLPFVTLNGSVPSGGALAITNSNARKGALRFSDAVVTGQTQAARIHPDVLQHAVSREGLEDKIDDSGHATLQAHVDIANRLLNIIVASDSGRSLANEGILVTA